MAEVVLKEGWLTKEGGNIKNWNLRLFVLTPTKLTYYRDAVSAIYPRI